jgi:glycosyltransferase involved in cell wall biosynthesis
VEIAVFAVCFNEEKMLPHFLNHYTRFADRIVIWDNQSTDRSVEIALSYAGVEVESFDTGGNFSEVALTRIRNECWKGCGADIAIVCDIDEILHAPEDLAGFFARKNADVFRPTGFEMVADEFPSDYARLITDQVKEGVRHEGYSKPVAFRPGVIREMNFSYGSHAARPVAERDIRVYESARYSDTLKLLHYKNLGVEYKYAHNSAVGARIRQPEHHANGAVLGNHFLLDYDTTRGDFEAWKAKATRVIP